MGNIYSYFTSESNYVTKEDLSHFFQEIDKNKDNVITKDELDKYMKKYSKDTKKWKQKYLNLLQDYEMLKQDSDAQNIEKTSRDNEHLSSISLLAVKDYVENEIMKTDANSKYIPDSIERKAYLSVYKTILEALCQLSNSTELTLLNHKLTLHLEPKL